MQESDFLFMVICKFAPDSTNNETLEHLLKCFNRLLASPDEHFFDSIAAKIQIIRYIQNYAIKIHEHEPIWATLKEFATKIGTTIVDNNI